MIRTKQITIVCASVALLCILCAQAFATRSASPNYATNSHEDMSLYYYGYVQCRPSYNEDGKHAQAGYIRYWRYDLLGNTVNDTGRLYTPYAQTDDPILSVDVIPIGRVTSDLSVFNNLDNEEEVIFSLAE